MRADMAKVIVERPRLGGGRRAKGYRRRLARYGEDGSPAREGIKAPWGNQRKSFNEHLGPLRRYLDSQVGRPWNLVFSEICERINRNSVVQDHVRDHIDQYVKTCVIEIDGVPCSGEGGYTYGRPLRDHAWTHWYVCPRTGLLRKLPNHRRPRCGVPEPTPPIEFVRVTETVQCRRIDGEWWLVDLRPLPFEGQRVAGLDPILNRPVMQITACVARLAYGAPVYCASRRRLGRKELRQFPIPREKWD